MKYHEKLDFFEHAEKQGVKIKALEDRPNLTEDESFYWFAYTTLADAGYADISQFCKDYGLSEDERADLIRIINSLRAHIRRKANADS